MLWLWWNCWTWFRWPPTCAHGIDPPKPILATALSPFYKKSPFNSHWIRHWCRFGNLNTICHNEVHSHPPHICRGQGRCPGKFSHSSGSSPGGVESIKKLTCKAQKWNLWKTPNSYHHHLHHHPHQRCCGVSGAAEVGGGDLVGVLLRGRVKSPTWVTFPNWKELNMIHSLIK